MEHKDTSVRLTGLFKRKAKSGVEYYEGSFDRKSLDGLKTDKIRVIVFVGQKGRTDGSILADEYRPRPTQAEQGDGPPHGDEPAPF